MPKEGKRANRADKFSLTPQHGIAVDAVLSRPGVFKYDYNGKIVREFRPPSEVLSEESIATLRNATVTVDHPPFLVLNSNNYKRHVVGHVGEDVRVENGMLCGTLYINDESTVDAILKGDLGEISPGYNAKYDDTPGTDEEFGEYDRIQKKIVYNHVGLIHYGEGRQGREVGIRLDSKRHNVVHYTHRIDTMDKEKIDNKMEENKNDQEEVGIEAKLAEILPGMVESIIKEYMAKADEDDEKKADEDDEKKADEDDEKLNADEDDEKLNADEDDEMKADEDDEAKADEDEKESRADKKMAKIIDKRLEAIRTYERVTGLRADHRKMTDKQMLIAAAKKAGVHVRADSSKERLLGLLEGKSWSTRHGMKRADSIKAKEPEFVSHEERMAQRVRELAEMSKKK